METVRTEVNEMLKPSRTLIQITQAINNITRLNTHGQHNERLAELLDEKKKIELWKKQSSTPLVMKLHRPHEAEVRYIELSRAEDNFKITE
jgi:hypothetical protein